MIFIKNPVLGKVKTRLAKTIGDDKALEIYLKLLAHTLDETQNIQCDKAIFYSDSIDKIDVWKENNYQQFLQQGSNLGERMESAFRTAFNKKYKKVIIIGSDCFDLTQEIIELAFAHLDEKDVVLGPAKDGGYYLLGMKKLYPQFFVNKQWSSENVLLDTVLDAQHADLSYKILKSLTDIDEEKDLRKSGIAI